MAADDTQLIEWALGVLEADAREALERQLKATPDARQDSLALQRALDTLALAEKPVYSSQDLKNRVLGAIEPVTRFGGLVTRCAAMFDLSAERISALLEKIDRIEQDDWQATPIPGVRILRFSGGPRVAAASCGLVQVQAGRLFPAHRHRGHEWVLVLQGHAQDDSGRRYSPGDLAYWGVGTRHSLRVLDDDALVFAVVLEKSNRWLLGRTLREYLLAKWRPEREYGD